LCRGGWLAVGTGVLQKPELFDAAVVGALVQGLVAGVTFEPGHDGVVIGSERVGACLLVEGEG
jgi:hypothetical protein